MTAAATVLLALFLLLAALSAFGVAIPAIVTGIVGLLAAVLLIAAVATGRTPVP